MECDDDASSVCSDWTEYFCDSFKPACFEKTWSLGLDKLPLHAAVIKGNAAVVLALLESPIFPVNEHIDLINHSTNGAPLHEAIRKQHLEIVETLLDYDAFVHRRAPDEYGDLSIPALTIAVEQGDVDIVRALLNAGADPAVTDRRTLAIAAELGHANVVDALLLWSKMKKTPLDVLDAFKRAAAEWQDKVILEFLKHGFNENEVLEKALLSTVNARTWGESDVIPYCTRFEQQCRARQISVIKILIKAGARIDEKNIPDQGMKLQALLYNAENKSRMPQCGITPLHAAAAAATSVDAIEVLLEGHASVNAVDDYGQTPLFHAAISNDIDIFKELLDWGADVNVKDSFHTTPLHMAMRFSAPPISNLLLERGADPLAKDLNGLTPLHAAAFSGFETNLPVIHRLLKLGADINARTRSGKTPLMYALGSKHTAKIKYLLERGAEVNATNLQAETALCTAIHRDVDVSIVKVLLDYGANTVGLNNSTALHWAVESPRPIVMAKFLLEYGLNPNVADEFGATPLIYAAKLRAFREHWKIRPDLIKLFLRHGANANVVDNEGRTAKDWARVVGLSVFDWNWGWKGVYRTPSISESAVM
ncbi:hypothetical protein LOZ58_000635 [Ophidiomyces ophidiicola]|nr:hypothetical protein LOZ58_000635 [Ophidiomyces ophidiicola]